VLEFHPDGADGQDAKTVKKATIGGFIGYGASGSVCSVPSHEFGDRDLVAKGFTSPDFIDSEDIRAELKNLRTVGQLRGSTLYNEHTWILMDKVHGEHLKDTEAYKAATLSGRSAVENVLVLAANLFHLTNFQGFASRQHQVHRT